MTENNKPDSPRVFISYSWDSPEHKLWVESFAQELRKAGIDAHLDAWRDESQSIDDFMMIELERADFVLAICTPQFKQKIIENAEGEVRTASGFEVGTAAALRRAGGKDVVPILRSGDWLEAAPSSLVSYRFYDFTGDDIAAEFDQLRDRLLGHVRKMPDLGPRSGPAAAPELPDIFEGGEKPAPREHAAPPPKGDSARSATAPASPPPAAPAAAPASASGGGKKWLWAVGGAVGVIVLLLLIPTGEESSEQIAQSSGVPAASAAGEGDFDSRPATSEEIAAAQEVSDALAQEGSDWEEAAQDMNLEWGFFEQEHGCYVQKELEDASWLQLGYDGTSGQYIIGVFTDEFRQIEAGKIQDLVFELDENPQTTRYAEAVGYHFEGFPGVYVYFQDDEFLWGLAQRHTLSVYWNEEPYRDYWVIDADLGGSYQAMQNLMACQQTWESG